MKDIFSMDDRELKKLEKFFKTAPDKIRPAAANVLNSMAFGTRTTSIRTLNNQLTVRKKSFTDNAFKVTKASPRAPLETMHSKLETVKRNNFTGWIEQETGAKSTRSFTTGKGARPDWSKTIQKKFKDYKSALKMSDYKFKNNSGYGYIAYMRRKMRGKIFEIDRPIGDYAPGFMFTNPAGRLLRLTYKDRTHQPPRKQWLEPAAQKATSSSELVKQWETGIENVMKNFNK